MIFDSVTNFYFWSVFVAWIVSCIIKIFIDFYNSKKFSVLSGFRNGGMPSAHSALMGSITFAIFLHLGLSPLFFLSFVLTTLILRDAVTVRQEVGFLGVAVNKILKQNKQKEMEVIYGHTLLQVFAGLVIGVVSSVVFFFLIF
jgi:uncharacterized protein